MTTLEEKQAELDAVQTAFDEYIVSSRELEEELDAELTKCREFLFCFVLFCFVFVLFAMWCVVLRRITFHIMALN